MNGEYQRLKNGVNSRNFLALHSVSGYDILLGVTNHFFERSVVGCVKLGDLICQCLERVVLQLSRKQRELIDNC